MLRYAPGSPRGGAGGMLAVEDAGTGAGGGFAAQAPASKASDTMAARRIMGLLLHQRAAPLQGSLPDV